MFTHKLLMKQLSPQAHQSELRVGLQQLNRVYEKVMRKLML